MHKLGSYICGSLKFLEISLKKIETEFFYLEHFNHSIISLLFFFDKF